MDRGPLEEGVFVDHPFKYLTTHKMVITPVLFTFPGQSGGVGNGELQLFQLVDDPLQN
jgi:hypothetical protein